MRYTGPKWRINRREGVTILGSSEKWKRRTSAPGMFPNPKKRLSDYAFQFREKQKVKRMYGMTERQFKRFYNMALKSVGNTGTKLLQLLEMRIDNVLFKLGFAKTRAQARQFISHGHILLNGKKHSIPSYIVKPGDEIKLDNDLYQNIAMVEITKASGVLKVPTWLSKLAEGGKVVSEPTRDQIDQSFNERLIIELYSR